MADTFPANELHTGVIRGSASPKEYTVKYKGRDLKGEELCAQLDRWASNGTIERDTAESLKLVARNPTWTGLSDRYFVLLGANAAMGPLHVLLALGANVIAVDIPFPAVWKAIITAARNSAGTLIFPLSVPFANVQHNDEQLFAASGANLVESCPEVARWLLQQAPGHQLTIGNYVYLDSALFVRVSIACDAIMKKVCEKRSNTAIAFLCTPTDIHVVPEATHRAAARNCSGLRRLLFFPFELSPIGKLRLRKNVQPPVKAADGSLQFYVDGIVPDQGFNYAISKRMQHWRCVVARSLGHTTSSHIAPSTATISVLKNRTFAWAYDGLPVVCPTIEIFMQETSNSVMTGLLINDLCNPDSFARADKPLRNPLELFSHNSFHGGVWTMPYTMASTGAVSVIMHFVKLFRPLLFLFFLAFLWFVFQHLYA
ncbi:MAG: hypothetical protein Q8P67_02275 [archaeon]|nr:hypothetical protein [archaeon]